MWEERGKRPKKKKKYAFNIKKSPVQFYTYHKNLKIMIAYEAETSSNWLHFLKKINSYTLCLF